MELSELVVYNDDVLTVCDKTGIVFKVHQAKKTLSPYIILADGNGLEKKGFKGEWMTVKGDALYVGSAGKENIYDGLVTDHNMNWIKKIEPNGTVSHIDWTSNYNALRAAAGCSFPGYLWHESACWSDHHQRWFFLPRRATSEPYDHVDAENRCANLLLQADEKFEEIKIIKVGELDTQMGYSSFRFIPGTHDRYIIATKTREDPVSREMVTNITVFCIDGRVLLGDQRIPGCHKFEGLEFL